MAASVGKQAEVVRTGKVIYVREVEALRDILDFVTIVDSAVGV
jgi:hypothetical protein